MSVVHFLIVKAGTHRCALPLLQIVETMRPLPVRLLANAPPFVLGVSVIRGEPLPVVDLGLLLNTDAAKPARFVIVRSGQRKVALAVTAVLGTQKVASETFEKVPPLLSQAQAEVVQAISALDQDLLLVLQTAHLLPEEVWAAAPALLER